MLFQLFYRLTIQNLHHKYSRAPVSVDSVISSLPQPEKKIGKLKKYTVHKFKNARQTRTGHNMVKSSSPNMPST